MVRQNLWLTFFCLTVFCLPINALAKVEVKVEQNLRHSMLIFPWKTDVAAAAFIRGDYLWVIFDKPEEFKFRVDLSGSLDFRVGKVTQKKQLSKVPSSIIQVKLKSRLATDNLSAYRHRNTWVIEIGESEIQSRGIKVIPEPLKLPTPRVLIHSEPNNKVISYRDPVMGDYITVIPYYNAGSANLNDYSFIDFNLLKTVQGVAIQKISDGLKVKPENEMIVISSDSGLNISSKNSKRNLSNGDSQFLSEFPLASEASVIPSKQYELWGLPFREEESRLRERAEKEQKNKAVAHARLALFYLANHWLREADTMLKLAALEQDTRGFLEDQLMVINAVVSFMSGNVQEAVSVLEVIDLEHIPVRYREEIRFWRNLVLYLSGEFVDTYTYNSIINTLQGPTNNFLDSYPPMVIAEIAAKLVDHQLSENKFKPVKPLLEIMQNLKHKYKHMRFEQIMAKYYSLRNNYNQATKLWDRCLESSGSIEIRARCLFDKVEFLKARGELTKYEYVDKLETLAFLSRDTKLEKKVNELLGDEYLAHSDYFNAMRVWSNLLEIHPNSYEALRASAKMSKGFQRFFSRQNIQRYSPFEVVSFFFKFREWMPVGQDGDRISWMLSNYLINLDLLNSALNLMKHQINNRLSGLHKEKAINQYIRVALAAKKPQGALDILKFSNSNIRLPKVIEQECKYLRARALAEVGQEFAALETLSNDFSPQADVIKADIYWRMQNWKAYNDFSEPYINVLKNRKTLEHEDVVKVIKQGISYLALKDKDALANLYYDFIDAIPDKSEYMPLLAFFKESLSGAPKFLTQSDIENLQKAVSQLSSVRLN